MSHVYLPYVSEDRHQQSSIWELRDQERSDPPVTLTELTEADESTVLDDAPHLSTTSDTEEPDDCAEPEVPVYSDILLLIDALEREDPTTLDGIETPALVNLLDCCRVKDYAYLNIRHQQQLHCR